MTESFDNNPNKKDQQAGDETPEKPSRQWKEYPPLPEPHAWKKKTGVEKGISMPTDEISSSGETRPSLRDTRYPRKDTPEKLETTHKIDLTQEFPPLRRPGNGEKPPAEEPPIIAEQDPSSKGVSFLSMLLIIFAFILGYAGVIAISGYAGWGQGEQERFSAATGQAQDYLLTQLALAEEDILNKNYDRARQRYEFIIKNDPGNKIALDGLASVSIIMNITASPTAVIPTTTPTMTSTPDLRPVEDMFASALQYFQSEQWSQAIETLLSVRQADSSYRTTRIDGMLYASLRNRGVDRILYLGELEEGLYDLTLAENFGPLDANAVTYQEWARLYMLGNAFWYAYPESAAYYYGQLIAVAPNLIDSSGMSAFYRFWMSLVHLADQTAVTEDWCTASEQYTRAMNARPDGIIQATLDYVYLQCLALTPSATPTLGTQTPTETNTPTLTLTPSATTLGITTPTPTLTPTLTPTGSDQPDTPTQTPTPTATNTPTYTPTPTIPTEDNSG